LSRIDSIEKIDLASDTAANTLTLAVKDVIDMAGFNSFNTGNGWSNVSGTALGASVQRHQLVVKGGANDNLVLSAGNSFWASNGTVSDGTNTYTVYQNDLSNAQLLVQNGITVTNNDATALAGDAIIDLGSYGKLMAPLQVEGKWYYHWDRSGDGTSANSGSLNGGLDYVNHDTLDSIFKFDINGNLNPGAGTNTTDTYRYATLNGVKVALSTYGGPLDGSGNAAPPQGINTYQNGTAVSNTTTDNLTYNDLLAIWDSQNGAGTSTNYSGVPTGWQAADYWSATPTSLGHANVHLNYGFVYNIPDNYVGNPLYVALQVL
jgi:hypothetical protein